MSDFPEIIKDFTAAVSMAETAVKSSNYYFEKHTCKVTGETSQIRFDNMLRKESGDKLLKFGVCPDCGTLFYHETFIQGDKF